MFRAKHVIWILIILSVGCSRRSGLEVSGNQVTPKNPPGESLGVPSDFDLGDSSGQNTPLSSQPQVPPRMPITDPFQNEFLGGQDPWALLDRFLPPAMASSGNNESRSVVTAGRYRITPNANLVGAFYRIDVVSPVQLVLDGIDCRSGLSGPIFPGVSVCLDIGETRTPLPVPLRLSVSTQSGVKNHTAWLLILPGKGDIDLKVTTNIPPVVVRERFAKNGAREDYQVQPSVFSIELKNARVMDEFEISSNDPQTRIIPQGNSLSVTTTKRGELQIKARRRSSFSSVKSEVVLKVFVPLEYSVIMTNKYGRGLYSDNRFRLSCIYSGASSQMQVLDPNGFTYLVPLLPGMVKSALMERTESDRLARTAIKLSGDAGNISCRGELTEDDEPSSRVIHDVALDIR